MKGWGTLHQQAAERVMNELERLDPANVTLQFARSVFNAARDDGIRPSGRPPSKAASLKREQALEKRQEQARLDRAISELYESGESMIAAGARFGVGQTRVAAALARLHVPPRPTGKPRNEGVDMARVDRIRQARERGETLEQIGAKEQISRERVRQICRQFGIPTKANLELTDRQLEAVHRYLAGESLEFAAAAYDVGPSTLRNWIIRSGHIPRPGRPNGHGPEMKRRAAQAARMYRKAEPIKAIAKRLGLQKPEMVYRLLAIDGCKPNRHQRAILQ